MKKHKIRTVDVMVSLAITIVMCLIAAAITSMHIFLTGK